MNKNRRIDEKRKLLRKKNPQKLDIQKSIAMIVKHLGLNEATPNTGTKNKRDLMERALTILREWKTGTAEEWTNRLSLRLNVSPRTAKDNYIDPLIFEGIIKRVNSRLVFVGLPNEGDEDE